MFARKVVRVETHTKTKTSVDERITSRTPSGGQKYVTNLTTTTDTEEWALVSCGHWAKDAPDQKKPLGTHKTMVCVACRCSTDEYIKAHGVRIFPTPTSEQWNAYNEPA